MMTTCTICDEPLDTNNVCCSDNFEINEHGNVIEIDNPTCIPCCKPHHDKVAPYAHYSRNPNQ